MKLYQGNLSPFASRVRAQIYAKGLNVTMEAPPGGLNSPEYLNINPTGKVPCLMDGNFALPESEVICEYLEDKFPTPALRAADAEGRAKQRLINRMADLYVNAPMFKLFAHLNPKQRDQAVVDAALADFDKGIKPLEPFVEGPRYAIGGKLSLADCALGTSLFFPEKTFGAFGRPDPLGATPKLKAYAKEIAHDPIIARVLAEMGVALVERMKSAA